MSGDKNDSAKAGESRELADSTFDRRKNENKRGQEAESKTSPLGSDGNHNGNKKIKIDNHVQN